METAEESFEGFAREYPFQTFKIHLSKKKEAVSIEFEAAALEAKLLLQGEVVVSISTEFIQNDDSLPLLRNRLLEGGDESDGRQKRECELKAFDNLAGKLHKSFPGEVFGAAMDSLYGSEHAMNKFIECGWFSATGFKGGSAPAVARKIAEDRENTEKRGVEFTEKDKNGGMPWSASRLEDQVLGFYIGFKSILIDDSSPSPVGAAMNRQGLQRAKYAGHTDFHRAKKEHWMKIRYNELLADYLFGEAHEQESFDCG
ncbi:MAG: hypothetical protein LBU32_23040 [Clostridiales bacterium]|jgi:hypothetical protein|nr:hypothetical protein [Clostridiales bacterium]